jgi:acetate---CoA ligase (ADP-forming)
LLQGFRGRPAADFEALENTLVRVSHLAMHMEGHLAELDINPLMVLPRGQGVKAVDALLVFRGKLALQGTESDLRKPVTSTASSSRSQ